MTPQQQLVRDVVDAIQHRQEDGYYGPYRVSVPFARQAAFYSNYYASDWIVNADGRPVTTEDRIRQIASVSQARLYDGSDVLVEQPRSCEFQLSREDRMNLYRVVFDGDEQIVEAKSLADAVRVWQLHTDEDEDEEPDGVYLLDYGAALRDLGLAKEV